MEILFLSAHLPSPRARQAGQKTSYYISKFLAREHTVRLLSFATQAELDSFRADDMDFLHSYDIVPVTGVSRLAGMITRPRYPIVAAFRYSGKFRRKLNELVKRHRFDFAYLEFTGMMQYREALGDVPVVAAMEVDVSFRWWERKQQQASNAFSKALFGWEAQRTKDWELEQLGRMDMALVQNEAEKRILEKLLSNVPVHFMRPWIELGRNEPVAPYTERERDSLVFWGAMDRMENADAVTYACEQILPRVWCTHPSARFYIVGGSPSANLIRRFEGPRVRICGFVGNPFAVLSAKQIALLPMRLGAGIKVKVLECMAAGLPVVTTPGGAEGIPGRHGVHFLVGRSEQELADAVLTLLSSPELAAEVGARARALIVENHFFEESLRSLEQEVRARLNGSQKESRQSSIEVDQ